MIQDYLHKSAWFVGLLLLQVLILNNVHIAGYATPFLYIYMIIKMDSETPRNGLMLWAFFLGLGVDLFSDTPGMNAASAVLLAFLRPHLLRLFAPRDLTGNFAPSARTMGTAAFLKYAAACVLLHHVVLISLDYFSAVHVGLLALHILASTVLTLACTLAVEGIRNKGL